MFEKSQHLLPYEWYNNEYMGYRKMEKVFKEVADVKRVG